MKQVINGKVYDTSTAQEIIGCKRGCDYSSQGYRFYKTTRGNLFKERTYFGCAVDGSTNRLSTTNKEEMFSILISYDVPLEKIKEVCPNFCVEEA